MANLSRDDRGQILLIAAFALAVIFVAMALIVNSAIFTENLATRGETAGSEGALSMRADVAENVGEAMEAANRNDHGSVDNLTTAVNASIRQISQQTGGQSARSGRVVDVTNRTYTEGTRIYRANESNFTNEAGDESYQLVGDVARVDDANGTRAFVIEASSITAGGPTSAFEIRVQDSTASGNENSWRARIWNASGDNVSVRTLKNDSGTTVVEECRVTKDSPGPNVTIDVTGGTIDGEECDALGTAPSGESFHFGAGTGVAPGTSDTYDISFNNSDEITGTYSLVVYEEPSVLDLLPDASDGPKSSPALYDVTVEYTYLTTDLRYETDVRVAPGEPDV
ncbi:hypothetical protein EGH22_00885 [Halomicroarcula sp. F28]|uniref:DUF7261 family protein n=1 Tax=Haloarcula salinisoli TaxID=2487746 RepID=UPI001C72F8F1|nr:hypothetical protein [Halomicroarcula salinisoli]MBX0284868.1 hypothetical protein [Halomicroarcula salinisoli]